MKRSFIALAFVSVNLIACCCGGVPRTPAPAGIDIVEAANKADVTKGEAKQPSSEPKQVFVFKKRARPTRSFKPVLTSTLEDPDSIAARITTELVSGEIEDVPGSGTLLVLKVRVSNAGRIRYDLLPWRVASDEMPQAEARDENARLFALVSTGIDFQKRPIAPGHSIVDTVTLRAPPAEAQEVDVRLPGENIITTKGSLLPKQTFTFKIGRSFFAKKEDARLDRIEEARQLAEFNAAPAVEAERLAEAAAAQRKAVEIAKRAAEQERIAQAKTIPYEVLERKYSKLDRKLILDVLVSESESKKDVLKLANELLREHKGNYKTICIYDSREAFQRQFDETYPEAKLLTHHLVVIVAAFGDEIRWIGEGRKH